MEWPSTGISKPLSDLCPLELLEKVSYGRCKIGDEPELTLHNARVRAEEFERDEKIEAENRQRRIISRYYFDLVDAMERGETPYSIKPPPDVHPKHIANIKAKAEAKKREAEAIRERGTFWSADPSEDLVEGDPEATTAEDVVLDFA